MVEWGLVVFLGMLLITWGVLFVLAVVCLSALIALHVYAICNSSGKEGG